MILNAVVEIIPNVQKRWVYSSKLKCFVTKEHKTRMMGKRAFEGFYGWVDGYGTPPNHHIDVIVLTKKKVEYGDFIKTKLIGVFKRCDGDHKLICIDFDRVEDDLNELADFEKNQVFRIYDGNFEGDEWLGKEGALKILESHDPSNKIRNYNI